MPYMREIIYDSNGCIVFLFSLRRVVDSWTCCKSMPRIFAKAVGCGEVRTALWMFVSHRTIDAVRTAHRILRNHEFYGDFKKSDLSV
ncbi:MAG: hypothetical protein P8179_17610 [Candidatus Thiodiazotropha sp.]